MKKWLSILLILILALSSVPVFSADRFDVEELNFGDNTMIIGEYAFDLNQTSMNKLTLGNFIEAAQTTYKDGGGDYQVYYKTLGKWYDMIADKDLNHAIDVSAINGDGQITYYNMDQATPQDYVYESPEEKAYKLNQVTLEGLTGYEASGYKLGFLEADNMDDVTAYCIVWSTSDFKAVHDALIGLSRQEINDMAEENSYNQAYIITNLAWADGIGNTYNSGQKDVISGKDFSWPGIHHFYALTLSDEKVLAVTEAQQHADSSGGVTIDIKPAPLSLNLLGQGSSLTDYTIEIQPFTSDERVKQDFTFISELGFDHIHSMLSDKSKEDIELLASESRGLLRQTSSDPIELVDSLKLIEDKDFNQGVYYVYSAHVGDDGLLGVTKALDMIVTAPPLTAPTTSGDGPGTGKIIAAGGSIGDDNDTFFESLKIEGEGTRVAILNTSHGNEATIYNYFYIGDDKYPDLKGRYEDLGFEAVYIPLGIDNYMHVNNHEYFASLVESCDVVYLQGGDQAKHAKALLEDDGSPTMIAKAIEAVYERGGVVAGTSAGSHVLSNNMFGWGTPGDVMVLGGTEERSLDEYDPSLGEFFPRIDGNNMEMPGLGLVPEVALTDTHFDARGRLGRLVQGLYDTGKQIGIGSDEGTALVIQENIGKVIGLRAVTVVDMSEAYYNDAPYPSFENVIIHYLTEGDTYNFQTGEVVSAHKLVESYDGVVYESSDIFSASSEYEVTKVLHSLAVSQEDRSSNQAKVDFPQGFGDNLLMDVDFYWSNDTESYYSGVEYLDDYGQVTPGLEGAYKFTLDSIRMDIVVREKTEDEAVFNVDHIQLKADSEYTQYIVLSDDVNDYTCTSGTSITVNTGQALYDEDFYDPSYPNEVRISLENPRSQGDTITLDGVESSSGEVLPKQTWVFDGQAWINAFYTETVNLKSGSDYTQYLILSSEIDPSSLIQDENIRIEGNSLYDTDFYSSDYPNEIRVSLYDVRSQGDKIILSGIKDIDGNTLSEEIWVFDGSLWLKE